MRGARAVRRSHHRLTGEREPALRSALPAAHAHALRLQGLAGNRAATAVLGSSGAALEQRGRWETLLGGQDFSTVRVHTGEQAATSASALAAQAYTVGEDIVFAEGRYRPQDA